jgi:hypothetical protein
LLLKLVDASVKISVISGFSDAFGFPANLTNSLPNRRTPNAMHAPLHATISTGNIGLIKCFNHGQQFNLGHFPLSKWIVLAIVKLGTVAHRKDQCFLHRLHEQLPMRLAIVLLKGIARKSFAHIEKLFNQPSANDACQEDG